MCLPVWHRSKSDSKVDSMRTSLFAKQSKVYIYKNLCLISVVFAFSVGLLVGIFIPLVYFQNKIDVRNTSAQKAQNITQNQAEIRTIFVNHSYGSVVVNKTQERRKAQEEAPEHLNEYPTVSFIERRLPKASLSDHEDSLVTEGIYWGPKIEKALPEGFDKSKHDSWGTYVKSTVGIKLETGCGRMQNRLVTFEDGSQGCVRYRQNTDQIQGELFSFYLAQLLKLPNLAPSTISVVNLKDPIWKNLANEISSAQWNSNRPVVLTKYITNLDSANIPPIFKPEERHLNKNDVLNMTSANFLLKNLVELAQWSDLIIFDYLTANLDRIVNNLYNYQWNINIMDAPAHNLARKMDNNLLVFLDNESGLLHGYRLLKKYEVYHTILLDNLCLFRKKTADIIKKLKRDGNVGVLLREIFERENSSQVKDVLPTLPDKSVKILNERIDKVYNQILKCEAVFSEHNNT